MRPSGSRGPLAFSATKLDDDLNTASVVPPSGPITIVANSMGAGIARGWLALDRHRNGHTAGDRVDSIVFVQGGHAGAWLLNRPNVYLGNQALVPFIQPVADGVANSMFSVLGVDLSRPASMDLAPQSRWYRSVNPSGVPDNIHYYNFYSSIEVNFEARFLLWSKRVAHVDLGDGIFLPGSNDPRDLPSGGGARFLPFGDQAGQHQYSMRGSATFYFDADICAVTGGYGCTVAISARFGNTLEQFINSPAGHGGLTGMRVDVGNITKSRRDLMNSSEVLIESCAPGGQMVTPEHEIIRVLGDPASACSQEYP